MVAVLNGKWVGVVDEWMYTKHRLRTSITEGGVLLM